MRVSLAANESTSGVLASMRVATLLLARLGHKSTPLEIGPFAGECGSITVGCNCILDDLRFGLIVVHGTMDPSGDFPLLRNRNRFELRM